MRLFLIKWISQNLKKKQVQKGISRPIQSTPTNHSSETPIFNYYRNLQPHDNIVTDKYPFEVLQEIYLKNEKRGVYLAPKEGQKLLDWHCGYGAAILGHGNEELNKLVSGTPVPSLAKGLASFKALAFDLLGFQNPILVDNGHLAYECVLELAINWWLQNNKKNHELPPQERTILVPSDSLSSKYIGNAKNVKLFKLDSLATLESLLWTSNNVVGILMDTFPWAKGFEAPNPKVLQRIDKTCKKHGVFLILDESTSGLFRCGTPFGFNYSGCQPNAVVLSNTLGAGIHSVSGVFVDERCDKKMIEMVCDKFETKDEMAPLVAISVLKTIQAFGLKKPAAMGQFLRVALQWAFEDENLHLNGKGMVIGLNCSRVTSSRELCDESWRRHLLVSSCGNDFIGITPPITSNEHHLLRGVKTLSRLVSHLSKSKPTKTSK